MFLKKFYDYFDSLNIMELGAFAHLTVFMCVYWGITNILSAYYGDKKIEYFNLETKLNILD